MTRGTYLKSDYTCRLGRKSAVLMETKKIIYGISPLGLLFIPEQRAKDLADANEALLSCNTWGEFRAATTKALYAFYQQQSSHFDWENDIPAETSFTPNDVVVYDILPAYPEIEMSEWIPVEIQKKYGQLTSYASMDMNVPSGNILVLDKEKVVEIAEALNASGYHCIRDDALILAAVTLDFEPEDYPEE